MSLHGSLEDVALVDLIQILNITRKTGTLLLEKESKAGKILMKEGNIIGASSPETVENIGNILINRKHCTSEDVREAAQFQSEMENPKPLGAVLIEKNKVSAADLKEALLWQIQESFYDLLSWKEGNFYFEADNIETFDDISYLPREIVGSVNLDSQFLLLEGTRILDERNAAMIDKAEAMQPTLPEPGQVVAAEPSIEAVGDDVKEPAIEEKLPVVEQPPPPSPKLSTDIDDDDLKFFEEPGASEPGDCVVFLTHEGLVKRNIMNHWRDLPFKTFVVENPSIAEKKVNELLDKKIVPLVVTDAVITGIKGKKIRGGIGFLEMMKRERSQVDVIVITETLDSDLQHKIYSFGAHSVLLKPQRDSQDRDAYVTSIREFMKLCAQHLITSFQSRANQVSGGVTSAIAGALKSLKDTLVELQRSKETSSVSLLLLEYISNNVERAVMFFARDSDLIALGAFGVGEDGKPIADKIAKLKINLDEKASLLAKIIAESQTFVGVPDSESQEKFSRLYDVIGHPTTREILLVPLVIEGKTVALVYGDNGVKRKPIIDPAIVEILVTQASIVLENALLERRIGELKKKS